MSSPVQNDLDKRVMYAPPWAREAPQTPDSIIAAIEQLRQERARAKPPPQEATAAEPQPRKLRDRDQEELPLSDRSNPNDIEAAMADAVRAAWTPPPIEPVAMPEPPRPRLNGPSWGMVGRLGGAVGVAAAVALFVSGAVKLPTIDISHGPHEGAKPASLVAQAIGLSDVRAAPSPIMVADAAPAALPPVVAPLPVVASPQPAVSAPLATLPPTVPPSRMSASTMLPTEVLTAYASIDTASVASRQPKVDVPQAAAPAQVPRLPELRALERDEIAALVRRGEMLLVEGDVSSARLLLRRAAEAGDGNAALMLAGTFDRAELARLKVIGIAHDHAQATHWYTKAVEHGSAEAVRRLQQLAQRD